VAQLAEAMRYKSWVRFRIGNWHWNKPSCRTMLLESLQPLTKMNTTDVSWRLK